MFPAVSIPQGAIQMKLTRSCIPAEFQGLKSRKDFQRWFGECAEAIRDIEESIDKAEVPQRPGFLLAQVKHLLDEISRGRLPGAVAIAIQQKGRPEKEFGVVEPNIACAVAYIAQAKRDRSLDRRPVKTVMEAFGVKDRRTIVMWRKSVKPSTIVPTDWNKFVVENGKIYKKQLRR
jgi:hypothetical protein